MYENLLKLREPRFESYAAIFSHGQTRSLYIVLVYSEEYQATDKGGHMCMNSALIVAWLKVSQRSRACVLWSAIAYCVKGLW